MGSQPYSSKNDPALSTRSCADCGGTGFRQIPGGVTRCGCCRKQARPPDPAPAPAQAPVQAPVPVSFGPPAQAGNHRTKILAMLRAAGPSGVVNTLLYEKVCKRPPSRIFELRRQGYTIRTIREGESVFRFVLVAEPASVKAVPSYEPKKSTDTVPLLFAGVQGER